MQLGLILTDLVTCFRKCSLLHNISLILLIPQNSLITPSTIFSTEDTPMLASKISQKLTFTYFQWNPQDTIENMSKISSQCCFSSLVQHSSTLCPQAGRSNQAGRDGARPCCNCSSLLERPFPKCETSVDGSTPASSLYKLTCKRELSPRYSSQGILSFWSTSEFLRDGSDYLPVSHRRGGERGLTLQANVYHLRVLPAMQYVSLLVYWLIAMVHESYSSKCKSASIQEVPCNKTCCCS